MKNQEKTMLKTFRHLLSCYPLTLICLALIWFLCLFVIVPKTPLNDVAFIDKWTHLVMYGGTTSVMWWEYLRHHRRLVFWKLFLFAFIGLIAMSGVIELMQAYCTTNRSGEWLDFAANTTGVGLGTLIGLVMWRVRRAKN
jgi:VanZ family protein